MHVTRRLACCACALLRAAATVDGQNPPSGPAPGAQTGAGRTLLAIFAHPDDEATVSPALAKYAAEGVTVHLAIATDGRLGVTAHAGIAAGDALAAVRSDETKCAAEQLRIQPLIAVPSPQSSLF